MPIKPRRHRTRKTTIRVGDKLVGKSNAGIHKGERGTVTYVHPDGTTGDIHTEHGANFAVHFKYFKPVKATPKPTTRATTNPTVKTIMDQIDWRDLNLAKFKFIKIDEKTLRVHKGKKNLDIKYNEGTDLYDIKKHTIGKNFDVKTVEVDGIYNDQLKDIVSRFFKHSYINLR